MKDLDNIHNVIETIYKLYPIKNERISSDFDRNTKLDIIFNILNEKNIEVKYAFANSKADDINNINILCNLFTHDDIKILFDCLIDGYKGINDVDYDLNNLKYKFLLDEDNYTDRGISCKSINIIITTNNIENKFYIDNYYDFIFNYYNELINKTPFYLKKYRGFDEEQRINIVETLTKDNLLKLVEKLNMSELKTILTNMKLNRFVDIYSDNIEKEKTYQKKL